MTIIKILAYTDRKKISLAPEGPLNPWSLSILQTILETKKSEFVEFKLEVINRYETPPQPRKIDDTLLKPYDQVWIFGIYQENGGPGFNEDTGGPENVLGQDEKDALEKWMEVGGVLVSGDHSARPPSQSETMAGDFLSLGKALGEGVPRAGQLRKWIGEPTAASDNSFNTLVTTALKNTTNEEAEEDDTPQQLVLDRVGVNVHHPIFNGTNQSGNDRPINIFPDHAHEGTVELPTDLKDWPPDGVPDDQKPKAVIVARGCDKRHCRSTPVLVVYEPPASVNVGRIVADSSWHHYLNINLKGLRGETPGPLFTFLSQFYRNLAFFLAPLAKREEVSRAMLDWIVHHPEVMEEKDNNALEVGSVALQHLSKVASRYEIFEMLQYARSHKTDQDSATVNVSTVDFPQLSAGLSPLPSREFIVGSIVKRHYRNVSARLGGDAADGEILADERAVAAAGVKDAFRSHKELLEKIASEAIEF